jgi:hypothetical protein
MIKVAIAIVVLKVVLDFVTPLVEVALSRG